MMKGVGAPVLVLALALALLTGCGSNNDSSSKAATTPSPAQSTAAPLTLMEICPQIGQLYDGQLTDLAPSAAQFQSAEGVLLGLSKTGDPEAQHTIEQIVAEFDKAIAAYADSTNTLPKLDASEAHDRGIEIARASCTAAGDSTFSS